MMDAGGPRRTEQYRELLDHLRILVAETDRFGRLTYISPIVTQLLGFPESEILGASIFDVIHEDDHAQIHEDFQKLVASGVGSRPVYRIRHANGEWLWFESIGSLFRTAAGEIRVVVSCTDITERRKVEEELRANADRFRALAETTQEHIAEVSTSGQLQYASPNWGTLLGMPSTHHLGADVVFSNLTPEVENPERQQALFLELLRTGRMPPQIARYHLDDGSSRWLETSATTYRDADGNTRILSVSRDITERMLMEAEQRELNQRVQESQRLESLGILAGGISHDFNNLLTTIIGNATIVLADLDAEDPRAQRVERIANAARHAAKLTGQMLTYSGQASFAFETLSLSDLVAEITDLMRAAISKRAHLRLEVSREPSPVQGDPTQIHQVVMNLITNASEALGDAGGEIAVRTGVVFASTDDLSDCYPSTTPPPEGEFAFVEVRDSGRGMDAETRARIFDPFFTTKFSGRGLGLAAVLGIVRGHGAAIQLRSEPDRGSTFRVLFPVAKAETPSAPPPRTLEPSGEILGHVLVIDDEEGVCDIAGEFLSRAGFAVDVAHGGRAGIACFRAKSDVIDLVLLDLAMPDLHGEDVALEIQQISTQTPILLMSGFREDIAADQFRGSGLAGFIQKPFSPEQLVSKIRQALTPGGKSRANRSNEPGPA